MNPERIDALTEIISASCDDLQQSSQKPDADINLLSGIDHVENIAFAAQMIEMGCLEEICHEINRVLFDSPSENSHSPSERISILTAWTQHVLAFLRHPEDPELAEKITSFLPDDLRAHYTQRLLDQNASNPDPTNTTLDLNLAANPSAQSNRETQTNLNAPDLTLVSGATQSEIQSAENQPKETDASAHNDTHNSELMGVFLIELDEVHEQLDGLFNQIIESQQAEASIQLWGNYLALVQRVKETATLVNLLGVAQVCLFVEENITPEQSSQASASALAFAFNQWIPLTQQYLQQQNDDEVVFALINHLESSAWPQPLEEDHAQRLLTLLVNYRSTNSDSLEHEIIPTQASAKDVSLIVASDASVEIVDIFLSELPQQTQSLSKAVADFNANRNRSDNLQSAQRLAHTLKGASNLIGVRGIANVSHYLEDILISLGKSDDLLQHEDNLQEQIKGLLQETCDCIEDMADSLIANPQGTVSELTGQASISYVGVLQKVLNFINGIDAPESIPNAHSGSNSATKISPLATTQAPLADVEQTLNDSDSNSNSDNQNKDKNENENENQDLNQPPQDLNQPPIETLRIPVKIIESLFSLVEELTVQMGATHDKVKQLVKTKDELKQQDNRIQEKRFELENVVDVRGIVSRHHSPHGNAPQNTQHDDFDRLEMDQFSEVHDATHSYIESVADSREISLSLQEQLTALDTLFSQQQRINKEIQRQLKNTRLVPIASIESRLQRCVRHACRVTGKQADVLFSGGDTMINDDVLNKLVDPLLHVLRNAVDHGIEPPEQRLKSNKSAAGRIDVSVTQRGQNIYIACQDDGAGINRDKVIKAAQQKSFLNHGGSLSDQQLTELLLQPGFSTRDQTTQISGRGVGMDAANTCLQQLNGELHLHSEEHFGTMVTFTIPIKLLATHALLIQSGKHRLAIPSRAISQLIPAGAGQLKIIGDKHHLEFNSELFEACNLGFLLDGQEDPVGDATTWQQSPVLIINANQRHVAIRIDAALASQELIIKSTGKYVQNVPGTIGVAILGDGSLVTLLDINGLLQTHRNSALPHAPRSTALRIKAPESDQPQGNQVLIVDDSLSVRRSLGQMMQDAGYAPILARDGLDAVEQLKDHQPDLMLVDLEMPRMNGIELTRYLRNNPQYQTTPIFMITSRSTNKHRSVAANEGVTEYFTKPYTETELLSKIHHYLNQAAQQKTL